MRVPGAGGHGLRQTGLLLLLLLRRSEAFGRPPGPTPSLFCLQKESPLAGHHRTRTRSLPHGLHPEPRSLEKTRGGSRSPEEARGGSGREDAAPRRLSALLSVLITRRRINTAARSQGRSKSLRGGPGVPEAVGGRPGTERLPWSGDVPLGEGGKGFWVFFPQNTARAPRFRGILGRQPH